MLTLGKTGVSVDAFVFCVVFWWGFFICFVFVTPLPPPPSPKRVAKIASSLAVLYMLNINV